MRILSLPNRLNAPGNFILVGGVTALVYYSLIYLLHEVMHLNHLGAVSIAYIAAVAFHFAANRGITFEATNGYPKGQLLRYALLALLNYAITLTIIAVSVPYYSVYTATVLAILATFLIGYLGMKYWVFAAINPKIP